MAKLLLDEGADINVIWSRDYGYKDTALHLATKNNHLEMVRFLLDKGAVTNSSNLKSFFGNLNKSPLHYAVENNNIEIAKLLIARGANVDAQDYEGFTPLYSAARYSNIEIANLLLNNGANASFVDGTHSKSILHSAVSGEKNVKEMIKLLLDKGANIKHKDFFGDTPLSSAVSYGNLEAVKFLLDNGANINIRIHDKSLLDIAIDRGKSEVAMFLVDRGLNPDLEKYGWTPLHLAVFLNQLNKIDSVTKNTININAGDKKGLTPLHLAAKQNHLEMIRILLDKGANIESKNKGDKTPLWLAVEDSNNLEVAKLLLEKGANVNTQDSYNSTPLHFAVRYHREKMVKLLLGNGANVDVQDTEGKTPIHYAIQEKNSKIVKLLYNHGANIDSIKDEYGRTASSLAESYYGKTIKEIAAEAESVNVSPDDATQSISAPSNAVKPSSFINSIFNWVGASTTAALSSLFQSTPALPSAQQPVTHSAGSLAGSSQVDFYGTALLADIVIRRFTGEKYLKPIDDSLLTLEQIKERKLSAIERDVKMSISKFEELDQCPRSSLSNTTVSKGINHQKFF